MRAVVPLLLLLATNPPSGPPSAAPASPQPPLTRATGGHVSTGDPRNPAIIPEQRIDVKFTHRVHIEEVGLTCGNCHESVLQSKEASDFNVPARSACMECHDSNEIPQDWGPKIGKASAISMPPANLHFSHARHLKAPGIDCSSCHPDVATKDIATRDDLPSMETCLSCHDGKAAPAECATCHLKGRGGVIKTVYDSGELKPDDHGPLWLRQHHVAAERDMGLCASCHAQDECLTCHAGSIPPTFHDGNYIALHPQDAQANNPPCASCHRLDKYCADCHFRAGVSNGNPLIGGDGFHPAGWLLAGDPMHHENAAKKNLGACMSCHAGTDCVSCHAFYTGAPTTHPRGWATSTRMERLRRANFDLCLQCHGQGEPGDPIPPPP